MGGYQIYKGRGYQFDKGGYPQKSGYQFDKGGYQFDKGVTRLLN